MGAFVHWGNINVWVRRVVVAGVAVAVLGGGYVWFRQGTPEVRLAEVCGGMLPVDDMLALTGTTASGISGADLKTDSWQYGPSRDVEVTEPDGLPAACRANGVEVHIEPASDGPSGLGLSTFARGDDVLPVPLGAHWSGLLAPDGEEGIGASVLLDCPNWDGRHGSGILVTASADLAHLAHVRDNNDPAARAELARMVTGTAKRAAQRTGCKAGFGDRISRVDSSAATAKKRAGEARGTCAGVHSRAVVRETAAGTAPVEFCVLEGGLRLKSFYGPFVTSQNHDGGRFGPFDKAAGTDEAGMVWGSATCTGAQGTALYWTERAETKFQPHPRPLTAREQADLRTFAERSAARHGCSSPNLPADVTPAPVS
ncbi:hypothetical protein OG372_30320 [Streptomyces sp. NBC_01020]|uniref:hypothetical protein n=1 Tax=Streptomyces sp. NBC_01020 TaxID=2903722 RepID=UPI0038679EF7|nr:hypothetical protein OG372_30320 [Streptomyces sp. NBC_01020]